MGSRQRLALLIVAGAHLALVAADALRVHPGGRGFAKRAIGWYESLSGTDSFQTFFDGGAAPSLRPIFEVTDRSGAVITDVLERAVNLEVDLRVDGLVSCFWCDDEALRRALAASFASVVLDRHPGAERVAVRVEASTLPSMEEYRRGRRPGWSVLYRAMFRRPTAVRSAGDTRVGDGGVAR